MGMMQSKTVPGVRLGLGELWSQVHANDQIMFVGEYCIGQSLANLNQVVTASNNVNPRWEFVAASYSHAINESVEYPGAPIRTVLGGALDLNPLTVELLAEEIVGHTRILEQALRLMAEAFVAKHGSYWLSGNRRAVYDIAPRWGNPSFTALNSAMAAGSLEGFSNTLLADTLKKPARV